MIRGKQSHQWMAYREQEHRRQRGTCQYKRTHIDQTTYDIYSMTMATIATSTDYKPRHFTMLIKPARRLGTNMR